MDCLVGGEPLVYASRYLMSGLGVKGAYDFQEYVFAVCD